MEKILVALDGSEPSLRALEQARKLAQKELHLVHVGPISVLDIALTRAPMAGEDILPKQVEERLEANGRAILDQAEESLQGYALPVVRHLYLGQPSHVICSLVEDQGFDCVVVGSRGQGKLQKLLLGSVSSSVVNHCPVPVLVVK